jgi:hypothetical protein
MSPAPNPQAGELRILTEGRAIDLVPLERLPVGISRRAQLHMPEHAGVVTRAYQIDVMTLHFIASSRNLELRMPQESSDSQFALWRGGRRALNQFVQRAGAP